MENNSKKIYYSMQQSLYESQQPVLNINNYFNNKTKMRQDIQERERQVRKLHENIKRYELSPSTKKTIQKTRIDLQEAIQEKYQRSKINNSYIFPRQYSPDRYQASGEKQVVNLYQNQDPLSLDLSIAEEPTTNNIYVSENILFAEKAANQTTDIRNKLKIKLFKKKKEKFGQTMGKRLKTEYMPTNQLNYSLSSGKDEINYKKPMTHKKIKSNHKQIVKKSALGSKINRDYFYSSYSNLKESFLNSFTQPQKNLHQTSFSPLKICTLADQENEYVDITGNCSKKKDKQVLKEHSYHTFNQNEQKNSSQKLYMNQSVIIDKYCKNNLKSKQKDENQAQHSLNMTDFSSPNNYFYKTKKHNNKHENTSKFYATNDKLQNQSYLQQNKNRSTKNNPTHNHHRSFQNLRVIKLGNHSKQKKKGIQRII